jgi:hypothetical protein
MNYGKLMRLAQKEPKVRRIVEKNAAATAFWGTLVKHAKSIFWVLKKILNAKSQTDYVKRIGIPLLMSVLNKNPKLLNMIRETASPDTVSMLQKPVVKWMGKDILEDIFVAQGGGVGDQGSFGERAVYSAAIAVTLSLVWIAIYTGHIVFTEKDGVKDIARKIANFIQSPSKMKAMADKHPNLVEKTMDGSVRPDGTLDERTILENMKRMM